MLHNTKTTSVLSQQGGGKIKAENIYMKSSTAKIGAGS